MSAVPVLSVVVPSVTGWETLQHTLNALEANARDVPLEILVPERAGDRVRVEIALHHPAVRVLCVPSDASIPRMRSLAFAAATAPTVAVIEDHVLVPADWARRIIALRQAGHRVVGGRVENAATERAVDWAAFLCEYHGVLVERPEGAARWLTGNNTAYDRELLRRLVEVIDRGGWEDVLHEAMRVAGEELWHAPALVVGHRRAYGSAFEYAAERFTYSRAWAALHTAGAGPWRRLWSGTRTVLLPPVLIWRIVTRAWPQRAYRGPLLRSLPYLPLFVISWSLGELAGAWAGDGGALVKVR